MKTYWLNPIILIKYSSIMSVFLNINSATGDEWTDSAFAIGYFLGL